MENKKPIYWYQGLFLQPQHFQQFDQYVQSLLTPLKSNRHPYFQGIIKLEIDRDSLRNKLFEISGGEFIFPDGTWVAVPGNALVPKRMFTSEIMIPGKPARIFLGLHKISGNDANVVEIQSMDELDVVGTRFVSSAAPDDVRDIHQGGSSAPIKLMDYALKLFHEDEIADHAEYSFIPVADLLFDNDQITISPDFIPPQVTLGGSRELLNMVHSIRDQVTSMCRKLEQYKSPGGTRSTTLDQTYLVYLLALRSLSRYVPLLHHVTANNLIHPWEVYGLLRIIVGELSTYSDRVDALGKLRNGNDLIPPYDHNNLNYCFGEVRTLIGELLESIVIGPERIVHLKNDNGSYSAQIPGELFDSGHNFYLMISTAENQAAVLDAVIRIVKVSSIEHMQILTSRALQGINLIHMQTPPPGIPTRTNALYFEIDQAHGQWQEIRKNRNICLFWSKAPQDMNVELVILRK